MTGSSIFTLVLTGDISVKSAQDVLGRLREAVAGPQAIALDTKAEALGKSLTLQGPPGPKLQAVLEGAGFLNPAQPSARFWTEHI